MEIKQNGTQPSAKGPADWFTGTVRIDPLFKAPELILPRVVLCACLLFDARCLPQFPLQHD